MLIPTKHENLDTNILVVGAYIIEKLINGKILFGRLLEEYLEEIKGANVENFFDALTFLYCVEIIDISEFSVELIKK